jgi:hypothetical protein
MAQNILIVVQAQGLGAQRRPPRTPPPKKWWVPLAVALIAAAGAVTVAVLVRGKEAGPIPAEGEFPRARPAT